MIHITDKQDFWNDMYKNHNVAWDLKSPTPVFQRIVKENKIIDTGKILIMGSGYGYDAIEAAKNGFDVTAVDFSDSAVNFALSHARKEGVTINFLVKNFFELTEKYAARFDIVYDYVAYCAISPIRRDEYAKLISDLLKCAGTFIALWFPVERRSGGPPFAIDLKETENIFSNYLKLKSSSVEADTIKPRRGREILQIYRKEC